MLTMAIPSALIMSNNMALPAADADGRLRTGHHNHTALKEAKKVVASSERPRSRQSISFRAGTTHTYRHEYGHRSALEPKWC